MSKDERNIEERKVTTTLKILVSALIMIIVWSVTGGIFYANLQSDIDGKAEREEFEKYKSVDSVNTRNIFIKLDKMEDKFDRLLENNNIKIPKSINDKEDSK